MTAQGGVSLFAAVTPTMAQGGVSLRGRRCDVSFDTPHSASSASYPCIHRGHHRDMVGAL